MPAVPCPVWQKEGSTAHKELGDASVFALQRLGDARKDKVFMNFTSIDFPTLRHGECLDFFPHFTAIKI